MIYVRPERPLLATLICIFEVFIVVLVIPLHFLVIHQRNNLQTLRDQLHSRNPSLHLAPLKPLPRPTPLQTASSYLDNTLVIAATITLWQMRRSAFWLLAAHFVIRLLWFLHWLPLAVAQRWPSFPPGSRAAFDANLIRRGNDLFIVVGLAFSASVAWYAYAITSPNVLSPPLSESERPA